MERFIDAKLCKLLLLIPWLFLLLLTGCSNKTSSAAGPGDVYVPETSHTLTSLPTQQPTATKPPFPITTHTQVQADVSAHTSTPVTSRTPMAGSADWKSWPVLPSVSTELRTLYHLGLENGNDPHAFSILGDCQSLPEVFLSPYASDPSTVAALPDYLQETVRNFSGSFDRYSPTVKIGTTTGALLWEEWNDNKEQQCQPNETPLDCELRVHRPSIVIIHIGTHWESRNYRYLTIILEKILEHGAVPVLVIKADNRELDELVNQDTADLAVEFDLPTWNFWASLQHLPDDGLRPNSDWELTDEAADIHRFSALEALDAVWRALR